MMTSRRPSTALRWLMPTATFVTLAIAAFVYFQGFGRSAIRLPKPDLGMPFVLDSSKGGMVDSRSLRGKPYAMFFGFTHCPEVCPTTIYEMSSSLERLGVQAEEFKIFFVTVDP